MTGPRVYKAINAVVRDIASSGIAKTHLNAQEQYQYRSIDDVLNRLAPLLAKHRLCVLPRVVERVAVDRDGARDELLVSVALRVAFDLISAVDESRHTVEAYGEALDGGDKATSKAMSSAFKAAMLQTFCIPVARTDEPDSQSFKLRKSAHEPQPVEGWDQWAGDITAVIAVCQTEEAFERVQNTNRAAFKGISRERPELYKAIGEAFNARRTALAARENSPENEVATQKVRRSTTPKHCALPNPESADA